MMRKKKQQEIIIIKGTDVMRGHRGYMPPSFRTGAHISRKDRPRDKVWRRWL